MNDQFSSFVTLLEEGQENLCPEQAAFTLRQYPGPALYVSPRALPVANIVAAELFEQKSDWWRDVEPWLDTVFKLGKRSPLVVKVMRDQSPIMVEWIALPMDDEQSAVMLGRNITLEKNLQEVLTESRDRFRDLVELMADLAWETRADGTFSYIAGGKALGYTSEELLNLRARDLVIRQPLQIIDNFETKNPYEGKELILRRKDNTQARIMMSARPLFTIMGEWRGARGICRDVTEERERQAEMLHMQRRDRLVAHFVKSLRDAEQSQEALKRAATEVGAALVAAGCGIYRIDTETHELDLSAESGGALPEIVKRYNRAFIDEQESMVYDSLNSYCLMGVPTIHGNKLTGSIWVWRPKSLGEWNEIDKTLLREISAHLGIIISQIDYQERLRILSECDGLTRLLNRRSFMEKLNVRMSETKEPSALFFLDMDNFKPVNDTYGHQRGDQVIKSVAKIVKSFAKKNDLAARVGGDEFILWCDGVNESEAEKIARELVLQAEGLRMTAPSATQPLGLSVGVAIAHPGDLTMNSSILMERADGAMYFAKRGGKSNWSIFDKSTTDTHSPDFPPHQRKSS